MPEEEKFYGQLNSIMLSEQGWCQQAEFFDRERNCVIGTNYDDSDIEL